MRRFFVPMLGLAIGWNGGQAAAQSPSDTRYLAGTCTGCHGTLGKSAGDMPILAGQPAAYIAEQMRAFREGKRPGTVMQQLAKGYSDEQIDALAGYFSRLPK